MTDRDFMKTFSGLLAVLVALTVVIFVVAQIVSSSTKAKAVASDASLADRIKPVGELALASAVAVANGVIPAAHAADGAGIYTKTCSVCHAAGVAGAPKLGDKAAWAPRIAQGMDKLYTNSIKGKNAMPPKGTYAGPEADVKAAVDYMVSKSK